MEQLVTYIPFLLILVLLIGLLVSIKLTSYNEISRFGKILIVYASILVIIAFFIGTLWLYFDESTLQWVVEGLKKKLT